MKQFFIYIFVHVLKVLFGTNLKYLITMALKTSPEKSDQTKAVDAKKSSTQEQSKHNATKKMKTLKKKSTIKHKGASTTVVINPVIQTSTPTICAYPTMLTLPYTPTVPVITTITPYVTPILPGFSHPSTTWPSLAMPVPSPLYSLPVPTLPVTVVNPYNPISPAYVSPYTSVLTSTLPNSSYQVSPIAHVNNLYNHNPVVLSHGLSSDNKALCSPNNRYQTTKYPKQNISDPGSYLKLPEELFPNPKRLTLDPNPLINEMCLEPNIEKHSPWILDIEFGSPRVPVTRPIAMYDVQFNSIHCKNTPGAIHPAFETCSQDLKRLLLFYYDCIISSWYKGYIAMNGDISVANFQSWLQTPMKLFGMCWP